MEAEVSKPNTEAWSLTGTRSRNGKLPQKKPQVNIQAHFLGKFGIFGAIVFQVFTKNPPAAFCRGISVSRWGTSEPRNATEKQGESHAGQCRRAFYTKKHRSRQEYFFQGRQFFLQFPLATLPPHRPRDGASGHEQHAFQPVLPLPFHSV